MILTILTMMVLGLLSCQKSNDSASNNNNNNNNSNNTQYGNVTFWINESASTVTVTFYGGNKTITKYYPNYNPSCGSSGCANYTNIPVGSYYYTARNAYGTYTWNGYINVSTGCNMMLLRFSKDNYESELIDKENMLIKADEYSDEDFE